MDYKFENDLSLEEIGLYATMLNEDGANFATAEQLAALSTDNVEKVKEILMSLLRKGYVDKVNDVYIVNRSKADEVLSW
ncbi:MAG: hypothetical protein IJ062_10470 [Firmicutes bacterium]|nr:hypothetical protein [Bacillota bacterium]